MSRLLWLWVLLLIISLILGPWWYQNRYCACEPTASGQTTAGVATTPEVSEPETPQTRSAETSTDIYRFELSDGDKFSIGSVEDFSFPRSSFVPEIPSEVTTAFQGIADYLKLNPDKVLSITGYYEESEANKSNFENLGLARADTLKNYLMSLGLPAASMDLSSIMSTDMAFRDGITFDGAYFEIINKMKGESSEVDATKALEELGKRLKGAAQKVYFETNSTIIIRTDAQRKFLKDAKTYLDAVPSAKLSVTGHTDSDGDPTRNMRLSESRAAEAKAWLVRSGFDANRIISSGKGETQPFASNETDEGRRANRRAEIIIIE